jgi:hypothetical protein
MIRAHPFLVIAMTYALVGIVVTASFVRRKVPVRSRDFLTVVVLGALLGVPLLVGAVCTLLLDIPEQP